MVSLKAQTTQVYVYIWNPPTESEMKLLEARRERSDKISKIMGEYLLKGYKMLGNSCSTCSTILLRDRQGNDYCVACSDLDSDADKDNPVVNSEAALTQEREIRQFLTTRQQDPPPSEHNDISSVTAPPRSEAVVPSGVSFSGQSPVLRSIGTTACNPSALVGFSVPSTTPPQLWLTRTDVEYPSEVVADKLNWAAEELKHTSSVESSIQLCNLIKCSAETLAVLKSLSTSKT